MEHILGMEAADSTEPTRRDADFQQIPPPDSQQAGLLHPADVNQSRPKFDEQADVPVQTDQASCCPPGAGYLRKNSQLESCPLTCPSSSEELSWKSRTHQILVGSHDDHSGGLSLDPLHTHCSTCSGGSDALGPADRGQVEKPDTVDALSTSPRPNGGQSPVTDDVLCDTVVTLYLSSDTGQTQAEDINEATEMTVSGSVGQHSQMLTFSDSPSVNLAGSQTCPQPSCHHSHHQENNSRHSNHHLRHHSHHQENNNHLRHSQHQENNNHHLHHHQANNNQCSKDNCVWGCPKCLSTSGCAAFTKAHATDSTNIPAGLGNGWIPTDISEEYDPLLHNVPAPPMQDERQYHVFFSHCPHDREWVEHVVKHLESPPYNYLCAYTMTSLHDVSEHDSLQQNTLCAAMLSERVVLVLSRQYVQLTWPSFEKTLGQLAQMSLHHQTVLAVLLEDCDIPESMGNLDFLDACAPDFLQTFTKRLKSSRRTHNSGSMSSDLDQQEVSLSDISNGTILTVCRLRVHVGWNSYLLPVDGPCLDTAPSLSAHGIGIEATEFTEIVSKVSGIVHACNRLPWILSVQPLAVLLLALMLWLPAFIAILVMQVDDDSGIALPVRLTVFLFPLGLVAGGYLIKWRRSYWMTKVVRLLVQNCVEVNQAFYFQGRPVFVTAAHLRANIFSIYFVYFDATDCVRNVDLLLYTCMENDWEKLVKLIAFYTRDQNYLSRMSLSERLTVMMSAPYLVKLVKQTLPQPPQERHVSRLLCLCQFTEECISRFAHGFDRADVPGLAELFVRHMPGWVSGSAVRRVQEELFHASHGLVH